MADSLATQAHAAMVDEEWDLALDLYSQVQSALELVAVRRLACFMMPVDPGRLPCAEHQASRPLALPC